MKKTFLILLAPFFLIAPSAQAANLPILNPNFTIVPSQCTSCPCGFAGTLQLVQNLVNAGVSVAFLIMILIIIYAGALFLFSPAKPENREMGKTMLTNAIIGMIIVLASWLIVDFIMKNLYNPDTQVEGTGKFGPWNEIIGGVGEWCVVQQETKSLFDVDSNLGDGSDLLIKDGGTGGVAGTEGCPTCVSLAEKGVNCSNSKSCTLDPAVADRVAALNKNFSGSFAVTEAFPPTRDHRAACHKTGTCVDIGFRGTDYTVDNIVAFARAAGNQGLRVEFETFDCKLRDAVKLKNVTAHCAAEGGGFEKITGNHFSVYSR